MCFVNKVWSIVASYCPIPINGDLHILDCINFLLKYQNVYKKLYHRPLETISIIVWSIWTFRNKVIFRNSCVKTAHVINITVKLFDDMRCYNVVSKIFVHECAAGTHTKFMKKNRKIRSEKPSLEDRIKINADASKIQGQLFQLQRDNHSISLFATGKQTGDCVILMANA